MAIFPTTIRLHPFRRWWLVRPQPSHNKQTLTIMKVQDVKQRLVSKDGKLVLELSWYVNNVLDHVSYVEDEELIF